MNNNLFNPNFTQVPNFILDFMMADTSCSEFKVLMYVCRRTYGFHKKSDKIAISQIIDGITDRDGKVLDKGTGLGRRTVINAIKTLAEKQIILTVREEGKVTSIEINENYTGAKISPVQNLHPTSAKSAPVPVQNLHPQKKEEIKKEIKTLAKKQKTTKKENQHNPIGAEIIHALTDIDPKNKMYYNNTTQRKACDFIIDEYGKDEALKAIEFYKEARSRRVAYLPTITTPVQLRDKWQSLLMLIERKQSSVVQMQQNYV